MIVDHQVESALFDIETAGGSSWSAEVVEAVCAGIDERIVRTIRAGRATWKTADDIRAFAEENFLFA